jgi:hypothetical protein
MSKPTQGPWVAIPSTTRWYRYSPLFSNGLWHILPANDTERIPICSVDHADDHDPPTRTQAEYDARLIAAAPDLYQVIKAVEWVDIDGPRCPSCFSSNEFGHSKDCELASAIAKAEGRS